MVLTAGLVCERNAWTPRTVYQQHDRSLAHHLDVPAQPARADEAAERPVRPVAAIALPDQPVTHAATHACRRVMLLTVCHRRNGPPGTTSRHRHKAALHIALAFRRQGGQRKD